MWSPETYNWLQNKLRSGSVVTFHVHQNIAGVWNAYNINCQIFIMGRYLAEVQISWVWLSSDIKSPIHSYKPPNVMDLL